MSQACCPEGTPSSSQAQTHDLTAGNGPQVYTTVGSCSALEAHWPRAGWCCTHTLTLYSDMSHPVLGCALQLAHLGADEGDVSLLRAGLYSSCCPPTHLHRTPCPYPLGQTVDIVPPRPNWPPRVPGACLRKAFFTCFRSTRWVLPTVWDWGLGLGRGTRETPAVHTAGRQASPAEWGTKGPVAQVCGLLCSLWCQDLLEMDRDPRAVPSSQSRLLHLKTEVLPTCRLLGNSVLLFWHLPVSSPRTSQLEFG